MAIAIVAACAREIWRPHYAQVGELWVLEVSRVREGEYQFFESSGQSQYVEPEMLQLESALALLPYELQLPSRVPEGFALEMEPGFYPPGYPLWSLGLEWTNSAGQRIDLWAATDEISFAAIEAPR
ncbi:MAG TPA: hypothetical protein VFI11_00275, partial [Anaerolineales bacterium]|nr:hypothetical protein [Anaerolineales bacterium]